MFAWMLFSVWSSHFLCWFPSGLFSFHAHSFCYTCSLKKVGTWGHCRRWVSCWSYVFSSGFWCKMCEWYRGLQLNILHWLYSGFRSLMASWEFFCCGQLPALPFVLALWFDTNFNCSVQSFSWKCQRVLCAELCLSCYNCEAHPWGKKI